ncbi:MAG: hypothetical protein V1801_02605 [Candidatus Falkowbacteria bacterium]
MEKITIKQTLIYGEGKIMKAKIFNVGAVLVLVLSFTGCAAYYGNQAQYDDGNDWYLLASSREVARIKADKLAFEKLAQSESSDATAKKTGFAGTAFNRSAYRYANIIVTGPERKGFYLKPQEKISYKFIPGTYVATLYDDYGNIRDKPWIFHVGLQTHYFMGEEVYWYLVAPP